MHLDCAGSREGPAGCISVIVNMLFPRDDPAAALRLARRRSCGNGAMSTALTLLAETVSGHIGSGFISPCLHGTFLASRVRSATWHG
jgi:hypothetical protein